MRKIILSMMVSVDGFIEGTGKELDWHHWNNEMDKYMGDFFESVDTIIMGRKNYELMADYWPTITTEDPVITDKMNNLPKLVFSKTLTSSGWNNCRFMNEIDVDEINKMKEQDGKNMVIFGGAAIASAFTKKELIDEYRIVVNPIILGGGTPLFNDDNKQLELFLMQSKAFNCGNVLLHYRSLKK